MNERNKRYRFSLRATLMLVTITAACLAFISHHRRLEQDRIEILSRSDETVQWDVYIDRDEVSDLSWTRWLTMKVTGGSLRNICYYVEFRPGSQLRDVQEFVSKFPEIQNVGLYAETATEDRIALLHKLPMLKQVEINGPMVNDESLRHLTKLPQQVALCLRYTNADKDTVERLRAEGVKLNLAPRQLIEMSKPNR